MTQPFYFPWSDGQYKVTPGLEPLQGTVFQIDGHFDKYRRSKLKARNDRIDKYYQPGEMTADEKAQIALWILNRLVVEHPKHFHRKFVGDKVILHSSLTNETLAFTQKGEFQLSASQCELSYVDGVDALMMQVQADMAVWRLNGESECLSLIHLFSPNHWPAEAKINKNFLRVHRPVAGMEPLLEQGVSLLKGVLHSDPVQRFAAGVATDQRLNHHPRPPENEDSKLWRGRDFQPDDPELYLRVERQVLWPMREVKWALFFIRTYFYNINEFSHEQKSKVVEAIRGMSEQQLKYKGLVRSADAIINHLEAQ
ncbi:MAG: DUF3445 domain-containing protein [Pseudobdellovibrionaceae bacterium]|nr:DUF3445 domain-containing protein [Bdellovibrionales bacterium]USN47996.1 MAG: DUF3445 domain-containing protein [Pseudobdellovibrionaceae bacterium]